MKIKNKINLLFTSLVSFIFILLFYIIFYSFSFSREIEFKKRLKNRALTSINLYLNVSGIDDEILKRINESTVIALQNRDETIYDLSGNILFNYSDSNKFTNKIKPEYLIKVSKNGEFYFDENGRTILILSYAKYGKSFLIVESAIDVEGNLQKNKLALILLFSLITGVALTVIIGYYFANRIISPLKSITKNVREISSKNLNRRIELYKSKDELYELSITLNEVMDRLQESFEIQGRFISNASHELSTPLTSILSQLEIVLQRNRTSDEYFETISSVFEDVLNLTRLTKSLLEFAKASGNSSGMELEPIRIDEILMNMPKELKKINSENIVNLSFSNFPNEENKLLVFGNAILLNSAIKNIVHNACRYSKKNKADISVFFYKKSIQISIKDEGPGINEDDLPFIYQPFYRGKNDVRTTGFGLGLSLSKRIISLHQGELRYLKTNDSGSTFNITLPLSSTFHKV